LNIIKISYDSNSFGPPSEAIKKFLKTIDKEIASIDLNPVKIRIMKLFFNCFTGVPKLLES
jgi:hypothetical protein